MVGAPVTSRAFITIFACVCALLFWKCRYRLVTLFIQWGWSFQWFIMVAKNYPLSGQWSSVTWPLSSDALTVVRQLRKCVFFPYYFASWLWDDTLPFLCIPWLKTGTKRSSEPLVPFPVKEVGVGTRVHGLDTLITIGIALNAAFTQTSECLGKM